MGQVGTTIAVVAALAAAGAIVYLLARPARVGVLKAPDNAPSRKSWAEDA